MGGTAPECRRESARSFSSAMRDSLPSACTRSASVAFGSSSFSTAREGVERSPRAARISMACFSFTA